MRWCPPTTTWRSTCRGMHRRAGSPSTTTPSDHAEHTSDTASPPGRHAGHPRYRHGARLRRRAERRRHRATLQGRRRVVPPRHAGAARVAAGRRLEDTRARRACLQRAPRCQGTRRAADRLRVGGQLLATQPNGSTMVEMPRAQLLSPTGKRLGELPKNFPVDEAATLRLAFGDWHGNLPGEIRVCVLSPAVAEVLSFLRCASTRRATTTSPRPDNPALPPRRTIAMANDDAVSKLKAAADAAYDKNPDSCSNAVWDVLRGRGGHEDPLPHGQRAGRLHGGELGRGQRRQGHRTRQPGRRGGGRKEGGRQRPRPSIRLPGTAQNSGGYAVAAKDGKSRVQRSHGKYPPAMSTSINKRWPGAMSRAGDKTVWDPWGDDAQFALVKFWTPKTAGGAAPRR